jgi:hypothetical protein
MCVGRQSGGNGTTYMLIRKRSGSVPTDIPISTNNRVQLAFSVNLID